MRAVRYLLFPFVACLVIAWLVVPPLPDAARIFLVLTVGTVGAWSVRSSSLLLAARRGELVVDPAARRHRLAFAGLVAAACGAAVAAAVAVVPIDARIALTIAGVAGSAVGLALTRRDRTPKGPRPTSRLAWLLVDTALPAACVAALLSVAASAARLHSVELVSPAELARHLAVTTWVYSWFLGLGGFLKGYSEQDAGLVVVDKSVRNVPNPLFVGGALGVALLFVGPRVLPALPFAEVLVVKGVVGVVVGGLLSLLGALQGARAASLGLKRPGVMGASATTPRAPPITTNEGPGTSP